MWFLGTKMVYKRQGKQKKKNKVIKILNTISKTKNYSEPSRIVWNTAQLRRVEVIDYSNIKVYEKNTITIDENTLIIIKMSK